MNAGHGGIDAWSLLLFSIMVGMCYLQAQAKVLAGDHFFCRSPRRRF